MHLKNPTGQNITARLNSYWYGEGTISDGAGATVEGFIKKQTLDKEQTFDGDISVIKEGVEKSFAGDNNSTWDVYRISGEFDLEECLPGNRYLRWWASMAVAAPYKVHFEESAFSYDLSGEYRITSQVSTDTIPDALGNVSVPTGASIMGQSNVTYICSDEYLEGTGTCAFDVYVPAGKSLKYENGVYRDTEYEGGNAQDAQQESQVDQNTQPASNTDDSEKIVPKKTSINISSSVAAGIKKSYTYTGKNLTPVPTITYAGKRLSQGKDYTLKYSANKIVGTANILICGTGNYTGTKTVSFKITKATNPLKLKVSSKSYKQKILTKASSFSIGASKGQGKISYSLNSTAKKAKLKVSAKGKVTVPKKCKRGTYMITVKAKGNGNYKVISKTVKVVVK